MTLTIFDVAPIKPNADQSHLFSLDDVSFPSRVIAVRVGRSPEPENNLLHDAEPYANLDENEHAQSPERTSEFSPETAKDVHVNDADSVMQATEDDDDYDAIQFLYADEIETDDDYEHDRNFHCNSPEEPDEEYDAVDIPVGFGQIFFVHEEVLRSTSKFFIAALSTPWWEGEDGTVDLPDVDPDAFAMYTQWLYRSELHLKRGYRDSGPAPDEKKGPAPIKYPEQRRWIACYQVGDYLQDPDFKDALVDAVIALWEDVSYDWPKFGLFFANIYKWSTVDSPHRRFVADMFVAGWAKEDLVEQMIESVDPESNFANMVPDILRAYSKAVISSEEEGPTEPWKLDDMCVYHEQGTEGGKCYKETRGLLKLI